MLKFIIFEKKVKNKIFFKKFEILTRASRFLRFLRYFRIFRFLGNFDAKLWKTEKRYEPAFFFSLKYSTRSFISGVKHLSVIICSKVTAFSNFARKWQKIAKNRENRRFLPRGVKKFENLQFFHFFLLFSWVFTFLQIFFGNQSFLAILEGGGHFCPPPAA